ncbi:MAG TPA: DUF1361 domain-containing protein [Chthoniobacterales bacterium]
MSNRIRWLLLTLSGVWCVALVAGREPFVERNDYLFLIWNLFLAVLPLVFSEILRRTENQAIRWSIAPMWFLFFPNAPYILTDLLHLRPRGVPLWYDLLLLMSCAAVALIIGFISLQQMQDMVAKAWGTVAGWIFVVITLFAAGFGIYLGRFLRWNSWDVVTNPTGLAWDVVRHLGNPFAHPTMYGVTIGFGVLLSLCYAMFAGLQYRQAQ